MYKNCYYDRQRNRMYLWGQENKEDTFEMIPWTPYLYQEDISKQSNIKTIDGIPVVKKQFNTTKEYSEYQKHHKDEVFENNMPCDIQFLAEKYHMTPDDQMEVPVLKVYSVDIEVHSDGKFPKAQEAAHPIVLINVKGLNDTCNISWGMKDYTGDNPENVDYHKCHDEAQLMLEFFDWWHNNAPDVVTGWNISPDLKKNVKGGFDLPYIINRTKNLFGDNTQHWYKLSPINKVTLKEDQKNHTLFVSIAGVSVIDYLALYKWYSTKSVESYKLDTVALLELGVGKLDYGEYKTLRRLYNENFNMYVDYNVIDNKRVLELEEKLGFIRLAQNLALLCHCQIENYNSSVALIEGLMLTHYRRNDMCAPRLKGGNQTWFPAAFVKEPTRGQYSWIVDLDIASSYPTAIITLNMSPETYFGRIMAYHNGKKMVDIINHRSEMDIVDIYNLETPITEFVKNREFPKIKIMKDPPLSDSTSSPKVMVLEGKQLETFNKALKSGIFTISPCGSVFYQNKQGCFSQVELETFKKRVVIKNLMKQKRLESKDETDGLKKQELDNIADNLFALQWAIKIVLNSAYGVTGVPYSRYFNVNISEAIASCGRRSIMGGQKYVNRWFKNDLWKDDKTLELISNLGTVDTTYQFDEDFVAYVDTDSVFIKIGHFLDNVLGVGWENNTPDEEIIEIILSLSKEVENYVNDCAYIETQCGEYGSTMTKEIFSITFKQEIVCKSALFIQKKKYGYHVVNEEGIPCDKIDVTGLEIIRSETPSIFRIALKDMLGMILKNHPDEEIHESYMKYKKQALTIQPEDISENKGIRGLEKYIIDETCIKGTPYHVRAAFEHNRLIKELGLEEDYQMITDESKNKLVYIKPNPYQIKCMMYDEWPIEFNRVGIVPDRNKMIDKFLTQKLKMLLEPAGRDSVLNQSKAFNSLFGL